MQKTLNRDDIIRMAREADLPPCHTTHPKALERFAHLVAAAERERIIAANAPEIEKVNVYIKALEDAVAVEREACAQTVESIAGDEQYRWAAEAIRARGQG